MAEQAQALKLLYSCQKVWFSIAYQLLPFVHDGRTKADLVDRSSLKCAKSLCFCSVSNHAQIQ